MKNSLANAGLLLVAAAMVLTPSIAQARFILVDAHLDDQAVGQGLERRGALFGEPVPGPYDQRKEIVVDQGGGDRAVKLNDTDVVDPSEMYWNLRDGMTLSGGYLTARIEFTPQVLGDYTVALRGSDQLTDFVAVDVVDLGASARFEWRDGNSPSGTYFEDAVPGTTYELRVELDVGRGTYDLWSNGVPVVLGERHGLEGPELGYLVVGHLRDGDAAGGFEYDLVELDWRPDDTATVLLYADFEDKGEDEELLTRGAIHGEPVLYSGSQPPGVKSGLPLGDKAMAFGDASPTGSTRVAFEFLGNVEPADQPVSVSFAFSFDQLEDYQFTVREQGTSAWNFLSVSFRPDGQVSIRDAADAGAIYATAPYDANSLHTMELAFETEAGTYSIWMDDERIVHRREHGITARNVGKLNFGHHHDPDFVGTVRVDRIEVHTLGPLPVSVPDPQPVAAARLLGATPNPFNPMTELRFELARAGRATLDIFDSRGRRVRRLVEGHRKAGQHRARWEGRDHSGRRLASGVYHARLEFNGGVVTQALTLVK